MMDRREFMALLGAAGAAGLLPAIDGRASGSDLYSVAKFGNARLLHFTDCHAQLEPVYFREPNVNIGIGAAIGRPPHLVGKHLLDYAGVKSASARAHAFTYLDFASAAENFGKVGGFAHLKTLIDRMRAEVRELMGKAGFFLAFGDDGPVRHRLPVQSPSNTGSFLQSGHGAATMPCEAAWFAIPLYPRGVT